MNKNSVHYDNVSKAWLIIMGENFHYGYFHNENDDLKTATDNLIELMLSFLNVDEKKEIIDIGCGTGNPAFYIHKKYSAKITGISNSKEGINIATEKAIQLGISDKVKFILTDATKNCLDSFFFDIAWIMESSHLIRDKKRLIQETNRVLKKGGEIILCDVVLLKEFSIQDIFSMKNELQILENSFGVAKMETLEFYSDLLANNGFSNIKMLNISKNVIKTLFFWKKNTIENFEKVSSLITEEGAVNFIKSCEILTQLFSSERLGYGIIYGIKTS